MKEICYCGGRIETKKEWMDEVREAMDKFDEVNSQYKKTFENEKAMNSWLKAFVRLKKELGL